MANDELYHYGVKGMRWGVRNIDKKKLDGTKKVVDASADLVTKTRSATKGSKKVTKKKMDLSSMTDQQLRERINRANLEKQYTELFSNETRVSKGKRYVGNALEVAGNVLAIGGSALGIALAVKELKGLAD